MHKISLYFRTACTWIIVFCCVTGCVPRCDEGIGNAAYISNSMDETITVVLHRDNWRFDPPPSDTFVLYPHSNVLVEEYGCGIKSYHQRPWAPKTYVDYYCNSKSGEVVYVDSVSVYLHDTVLFAKFYPPMRNMGGDTNSYFNINSWSYTERELSQPSDYTFTASTFNIRDSDSGARF